MAFNGSNGSGSASNTSAGNSANGGNQDGPMNKRLCTGKENNESGINSNNRVSFKFPNQNMHEKKFKNILVFSLLSMNICNISRDHCYSSPIAGK